jgi:hypothetical protein
MYLHVLVGSHRQRRTVEAGLMARMAASVTGVEGVRPPPPPQAASAATTIVGHLAVTFLTASPPLFGRSPKRGRAAGVPPILSLGLLPLATAAEGGHRQRRQQGQTAAGKEGGRRPNDTPYGPHVPPPPQTKALP